MSTGNASIHDAKCALSSEDNSDIESIFIPFVSPFFLSSARHIVCVRAYVLSSFALFAGLLLSFDDAGVLFNVHVNNEIARVECSKLTK